MATLTVTNLSRAGSDLAALAVAAAGGGDKFTNTGSEVVYIKNASGSAITLTLVFASTATVDGQAATARTVTLAAGKDYLAGPFPTHLYNDATGFMNLTYSGVTTLTVAVFKITPNA